MTKWLMCLKICDKCAEGSNVILTGAKRRKYCMKHVVVQSMWSEAKDLIE